VEEEIGSNMLNQTCILWMHLIKKLLHWH